MTGQEHSKTSIVYEFPKAEGDPDYPVPRAENQEIYKQYKALVDDTAGIYFVGRLATYKYYNMDQAELGIKKIRYPVLWEMSCIRWLRKC